MYQNNPDVILGLFSRTMSYKQQDAVPMRTTIITDASHQRFNRQLNNPFLYEVSQIPRKVEVNNTKNDGEQQQQNKSTCLKRGFVRM